MTETIIRRVRIDDSGSIQNLSAQLGYVYSETETISNIEEISNSHNDMCYVLLENDSVKGYIHIQLHITLYMPKVINVLGLVIDENCRKKSYGRMLMNAAEKWAKENNCTGVRLNSGESREEAHLFYRKIGYTNNKNHKCFIKIF